MVSNPRILALLFSLIFILLFRFSPALAGVTGKIAGQIVDKESGDPLIGANVTLTGVWIEGEEAQLGVPLGAATDADGFYFIINVEPGVYSVEAFYLGYQQKKRIQVEVFVDKTTAVNFELTPTAIEGEEVTVEAYTTPRIEVDQTATKQVYRIDQVEDIAGLNDIADIIDLQADVIDNHFRGGREGESLYLIDGATINNPLNNQRSFEPIVTGLQQVEVFTSGFNAEYGNAQSGVVNMVPKEGGAKWKSRLEFSMDLPHYQTWGGDPYTTDYMPFWNKLNNPEEWLNQDDEGDYFFQDYVWFPDGYTPTSADSLRAAKLARANYVQAVRDIGLEYDNFPQYRLDVSTGGPISKKARVFVAARQQKETPIIPTPNPDLRRQWMSNLAYRFSENDKLTFSFNYNTRFQNRVDSDYDSWFDRIFQVTKRTQSTHQYGFDWNHVFSRSSFLDLDFRVLKTLERERPEYVDPDRTRNDMGSGGDNPNMAYVDRYRNLPSGHDFSDVQLDRGTEKTNTYSLNTSFTSQINNNHLIKSGIQFSLYDFDVYSESNFKSPGEKEWVDFNARPYEGAVYIQDKMEFQGIIANIGFRLDIYDFNTTYYTDTFEPLKNPLFDQGIGDFYDMRYAATEETKPFAKFQPRLGISFPVSEKTVFHFNYGTFIQRPGFNRIFWTEFINVNQFNRIGNPELKPEKTSAYDIGIVHSLPFGMVLDVSAYYKDVKDLVQEAQYQSIENLVYFKYGNLDYANIKGFHVNLENHEGQFFRYYLNYNYQIASGKAPEPGGGADYIIKIYEDPSLYFQREPRDVLMDYDRKHRFVGNVRFFTPKKFSFSMGGFRPFANLTISTTYRFQTGTPYTDDENFLGLRLNARTPTEHDLKIRIQKNFTAFGLDYGLYFEGFNMLNYKVFDSDMFTNNYNLQKYKNVDESELIWYYKQYDEDGSDIQERYRTSLEQEIYRNDPRYYRIGLQVRF